MAEILGIVSSVITVVETAGKLGTSAIKLKQLWDEVQDVPETIKRQLQHLDMLVPVFADMEDEFQQTRNMVRGDRAAIRSLEYCRRAATELEGLVEDMQLQVASANKGKRTIAKFKVAMKKGALQQFHERLESALQLLSIAQQTYLIALTRAQPSIMLSEFQAVQAQSRETDVPRVVSVEEETDTDDTTVISLRDADSRPRNCVIRQTCQSQSASSNLKRLPLRKAGFLPIFAYEAAEVSDKLSFPGNSQLYRARVQFPWWLARRAWDFRACKAYDGWKIQLTPWCTRSEDSEVFDYAILGMTDELLAAIETKEASLYDRDPDGWTLLDYALYTPHIATCKSLLSMGLDFGEKGANLVSCPGYHSDQAVITLDEMLEWIQFLADRGDFDDELEVLFYTTDQRDRLASFYLRMMMWTIPGLAEIVKRTIILKYDKSAATLMFRILFWDDVDMGLLLNMLTTQDLVSPRCFWAQQSGNPYYGNSFLYKYVSKLMEKALYGSNSYLIDDERLLARWLFSGSSPVEVLRVNGLGSSFLNTAYEYDRGTWRPVALTRYKDFEVDMTKRYMPSVMQMWLEDLMEAGVDLEAYGQMEAACLPADVSAGEINIYGGWYHASMRPYVVALEYGPRPEDWKIGYDPCVEEFAGEFWWMLGKERERPMPGPMPGGWESDSDDEW